MCMKRPELDINGLNWTGEWVGKAHSLVRQRPFLQLRNPQQSRSRSTLVAKFVELIASGNIEAHGNGLGVYYAKKS
jgi:hypothetical protein